MRHPSSELPEHVSDGYTHPAAHNNNPALEVRKDWSSCSNLE